MDIISEDKMMSIPHLVVTGPKRMDPATCLYIVHGQEKVKNVLVHLDTGRREFVLVRSYVIAINEVCPSRIAIN